MKIYIVQFLRFGRDSGDPAFCASLESAMKYVEDRDTPDRKWLHDGEWWYTDGDEVRVWTIREVEVIE